MADPKTGLKHLDPKQLSTKVKASPKKRPSLKWIWLAAVATAAIGLGVWGTSLFAVSSKDLVSKQEVQQRQIDFTKVRDISLASIDPARMDEALDEMRLAPTERATMRSLLDKPSAQITSISKQAPTAPSSQENALRLVSIMLWDTHAADGDVVAIVSGGYRREVGLTKAPQPVTFPVDNASTVQIIGVRDGGGGITLGVQGSSQAVVMPIMSEGQVISLPIAR